MLLELVGGLQPAFADPWRMSPLGEVAAPGGERAQPVRIVQRMFGIGIESGFEIKLRQSSATAPPPANAFRLSNR